jgi:hypothetical protein
MGSYLYEVDIEIEEMGPLKWKSLVKACSGKIDSLVELSAGKIFRRRHGNDHRSE